MKPIILTGIDDVVVRGDLVSRAIFLRLNPIPEDKRRSDVALRREFNSALPAILGALLDAAAGGLRNLSNTRLARLPRMADFALWATACEGALWPAGTFMAAYEANRDEPSRRSLRRTL